MSNKQLKSTKENLKSHHTDKKRYNRKILIGSLIATLIAGTPFLFYLYEFVPTQKTWDTWLFTYDSNNYGDANVAMWVLAMKIIPLLLALIWFFTCKHWWYHVLIVPIAMFTFQVVSAFNADVYMDEVHILYLLPIMAIVFPSIYLIRARMFNKINDEDKTMEELEQEFMVKPKTFWAKVKQYF